MIGRRGSLATFLSQVLGLIYRSIDLPVGLVLIGMPFFASSFLLVCEGRCMRAGRPDMIQWRVLVQRRIASA